MHVQKGMGSVAVLLLLQQCLTSRMVVNAMPARNDFSVDIILWPTQPSTKGSDNFGACPDNSEMRVPPIEMIGKAIGNGVS